MTTEAQLKATELRDIYRQLRARGWSDDDLEGVHNLACTTWELAGRTGTPFMRVILDNLIAGGFDFLLWDEDSQQGNN